ncbi:hypothetical protein TNCV_4613081 [Trichonephila clavipes]|nr:hypothetical protein TNCV_4613081 [Trichonephila clavipes]
MTLDTVDGVRTVKSLGSKDMNGKCREWQQLNQTKKFVPCLNCGGRVGGVAIYRPIGEFRQANSYCHLYGGQGKQEAYFLPR